MRCRCSLWRQCSRSICDHVGAGYFRAGDSQGGLSFLQLPITSARLCVLTNGSVCSSLITTIGNASVKGTLGPQLTGFDANVGTADLASLVFSSAEVVIVMDVAVVGRGREGVQLQCAIGVHVSDVGHVVDVVAGGQVPAQYGTGGASCWTGQGHPH